MKYRTLPNSDVRVSTIGLGTYALGGTYGPTSREGLCRTVQRALDCGVTLFDTAPVYGASPGDAERAGFWHSPV